MLTEVTGIFQSILSKILVDVNGRRKLQSSYTPDNINGQHKCPALITKENNEVRNFLFKKR